MWQFTPVALLYGASTLISYALAYHIWRMRPARSTTYASLLLFSAGTWSLGYLLGFFNTELAWRLIFLRVEFLGIFGSAYFFILFSLIYSHYERWVTRTTIILLAIIPVSAFFLVLTVQNHDLIYQHFGLTTEAGLVFFEKVYGPAFWVSAVFNYLAVTSGAIILIQAIIRFPALFRGQITILIIAALIPLISNALYLTGLNPFAPYDPSAISFTLTGLLVALSMSRYRLFDIIPVAHDLVFKDIHSGVIVINNRSQIQDMNPAAEQMLDRSRDSIIGKNLIEAFLEHRKLIQRFQDVVEIATEISIEDRNYELQVSPLYNRARILSGQVIILHDITERQQAEAERLALAIERERVALLADFIKGVSHEFRTPLSVINTDLYLLKREFASQPSAERLVTIKEQATYIQALLEAMLILSRLDSEVEFVFEPLMLSRLLRDLEDRICSLAQEKKITLTFGLDSDLPPIQGDEQELYQAFYNLLKNAMQYTPAGGTITVQTWVADNSAVVEIRDTGIGISDADLPHIFDRFYRTDKARTIRRAGLGLSIAQKIVAAHQGTIEVESVEGQGSVFRVVLPLDSETLTAADQEAVDTGHDEKE